MLKRNYLNAYYAGQLCKAGYNTQTYSVTRNPLVKQVFIVLIDNVLSSSVLIISNAYNTICLLRLITLIIINTR